MGMGLGTCGMGERKESGIVHMGGWAVGGIGQMGSHKKDAFLGRLTWEVKYKVYMSRHLFGSYPSCW